MSGSVLWYILAGLAGGLFGGMGLGGGTLLIPILTLILGVDGRVAAWLNLLTFLPMSVIAIFLHSRKGLVDWREVCAFVPPAFVSTAVFSLLSTQINGAILRKIFGWFLIASGSVFFVVSLVKSAQDKKTHKKR